MAVSDRGELTGPRSGLARDLGDGSTAGIPAATYCSWGASQTVSCPGSVPDETSNQPKSLRQKGATSVPASAPPLPLPCPTPRPAPPLAPPRPSYFPVRTRQQPFAQRRDVLTPRQRGDGDARDTRGRTVEPSPSCLEKRFPSQTAHRKRKRHPATLPPPERPSWKPSGGSSREAAAGAVGPSPGAGAAPRTAPTLPHPALASTTAKLNAAAASGRGAGRSLAGCTGPRARSFAPPEPAAAAGGDSGDSTRRVRFVTSSAVPRPGPERPFADPRSVTEGALGFPAGGWCLGQGRDGVCHAAPSPTERPVGWSTRNKYFQE